MAQNMALQVYGLQGKVPTRRELEDELSSHQQELAALRKGFPVALKHSAASDAARIAALTGRIQRLNSLLGRGKPFKSSFLPVSPPATISPEPRAGSLTTGSSTGAPMESQWSSRATTSPRQESRGSSFAPSIDYEILLKGPIETYRLDLQKARAQSLSSAMAQVDRMAKLGPVDRQRVIDALSRRYLPDGTISRNSIQGVLGYVRRGSYGIAHLAAKDRPFTVYYSDYQKPYSLKDEMLDLDLEFGKNQRYWTARQKIKSDTRDANAAPKKESLSELQRNRIALSAMGEDEAVRTLDAYIERQNEWAKHPDEPWRSPGWPGSENEERAFATDYGRVLPRQEDGGAARRYISDAKYRVLDGPFIQLGQWLDTAGMAQSMAQAGRTKEQIRDYYKQMGMLGLTLIGASPALAMGGMDATALGMAKAADLSLTSGLGVHAGITLMDPDSTAQQKQAAALDAVTLGLGATNLGRKISGSIAKGAWSKVRSGFTGTKFGQHIDRFTAIPDGWLPSIDHIDTPKRSTEGWIPGTVKERGTYELNRINEEVLSLAEAMRDLKSEKVIFLEPDGTSYEVLGDDSKGYLDHVKDRRPKPNSIEIHNHPLGLPPSDGDLSHFLTSDRKEMIVISKDKIYHLTRTRRLPPSRVSAEIYLSRGPVNLRERALRTAGKSSLLDSEKSMIFWNDVVSRADDFGLSVRSAKMERK